MAQSFFAPYDAGLFRLAALGREQPEVELEGGPFTLQDRRVELPEHAGRDPSRLAGMEERIVGALVASREVKCSAERSNGPLGAEEPTSADAGDDDMFVGQVLSAREVHARDLEQRDPFGADLGVVPRRPDEAREEPRAEHRELL